MQNREIVIILHNIRSTYNVGSILRTADGFGVNRVIYSGYTPTPLPYSKLLPHLAAKLTDQIHKTALGAEQNLKSSTTDDIERTLNDLKNSGFQIIGLENNLSGKITHLINDPETKTYLKDKVAILLGEEVLGIPKELHSLVDLFLEIPMYGEKESFNVSIATAILLFYLRCL
jgi:tRNA/rRNA methyltransferase